MHRILDGLDILPMDIGQEWDIRRGPEPDIRLTFKIEFARNTVYLKYPVITRLFSTYSYGTLIHFFPKQT